jgi:hypothetical protein
MQHTAEMVSIAAIDGAGSLKFVFLRIALALLRAPASLT